jgi:hypothetical protein
VQIKYSVPTMAPRPLKRQKTGPVPTTQSQSETQEQAQQAANVPLPQTPPAPSSDSTPKDGKRSVSLGGIALRHVLLTAP